MLASAPHSASGRPADSTAPVAPPQPSVASGSDPTLWVTDRYRLEALLGVGPTAHVYAATDQHLTRRVALKLFRPEITSNLPLMQCLRDDAMSATQLSHPSILTSFDWGEDDDHAYVVTELPEGGSLQTMIAAHRSLTHAQVIPVAMQVADALRFAAKLGWVHLAVKPSNLLFDRMGRVRLADFGQGRAFAPLVNAAARHGVVDAVRYAPPEAIRGTWGSPGDLYSLVLAITEAVVGNVPLLGATAQATLETRAHHDLLVLPELGPLAELFAAVCRADPAQRLDVNDFVHGLDSVAGCLHEPQSLPLAPPVEQAVQGEVTRGPKTESERPQPPDQSQPADEVQPMPGQRRPRPTSKLASSFQPISVPTPVAVPKPLPLEEDLERQRFDNSELEQFVATRSISASDYQMADYAAPEAAPEAAPSEIVPADEGKLDPPIEAGARQAAQSDDVLDLRQRDEGFDAQGFERAIGMFNPDHLTLGDVSDDPTNPLDLPRGRQADSASLKGDPQNHERPVAAQSNEGANEPDAPPHQVNQPVDSFDPAFAAITVHATPSAAAHGLGEFESANDLVDVDPTPPAGSGVLDPASDDVNSLVLESHEIDFSVLEADIDVSHEFVFDPQQGLYGPLGDDTNTGRHGAISVGGDLADTGEREVGLRSGPRNGDPVVDHVAPLQTTQSRLAASLRDSPGKRSTILLAVVAAAAAISLLMIVSGLGTRVGGRTLLTEMPDFRGQTVLEVRSALRGSGWTIEVTAVSDERGEPGTVLSHDPGPGVSVGEPGVLQVSIVEELGLARLPQLTGLDLDRASQALRDRGFIMGVVTERHAELAPVGEIIDVRVGGSEPNEQLEAGATIDLVVSAGSLVRPLPDFAGDSLERVEQVAAERGLQLQIEYVASASDVSGRVVRTVPEANAPVRRGHSVRVVVSRGVSAEG